MSDLQLERSVLEAKERDELFAIALALGTSPAGAHQEGGPGLAHPPGHRRGARASANNRKPRRPRARGVLLGPRRATPPRRKTASNSSWRRPTAMALSLPRKRHRRKQSTPLTPRTPLTPLRAPAAPDVEAAEPASPSDKASSGPSEGPSADGSAPFQRGGRPVASATTPTQASAIAGGAGGATVRSRRVAPSASESSPRQSPEVPYTGELVACSGLLDLREEGYGFLRANGYLASSSDVYVSITQVRRYGLRKGDMIDGVFRPAANNEKYPALVRVDAVAGTVPDEARNRPKFENLTPLFPDEKLSLEVPGDPANVTARIVDLVVADREGPARHDRLSAQSG